MIFTPAIFDGGPLDGAIKDIPATTALLFARQVVDCGPFAWYVRSTSTVQGRPLYRFLGYRGTPPRTR